MNMTISLVLLLVGFVFAYELFRCSSKLTFIVFIILPWLLLPWWIGYYHFSWFFWAKIYSVTFDITLIFIYRYTRFSESKLLPYAIWIIFLINIGEAMLYDAVAINRLQLINVVTGLILIYTMPGPGSMSIDKTTTYRDFSWDISYRWILAYTLWNWIFVYGNWPEIGCRHHLAVLGAPLLIALYNRKHWVQARAFTLGTYFMVWFSLYPLIKEPNATSWYNANIYSILAFCTLCYTMTLLGSVSNGFSLLKKRWNQRKCGTE